MKIIHHQDKNKTAGYLELVRRKYGNQKNFNYIFDDLKNSLNFSFSNKNQEIFLIDIKNEEKTVGHVGLIVGSRQKGKEAFFGFFEVQNDKAVFDVLWNELMSLAKRKGVEILKGPVNGSTWHQYRVLSSSFEQPFFKTEMFCCNYYYDFFKSANSVKEILYYSAYRTRFDAIISATKSSYIKLLGDGFLFEEIKHVSIEYLSDILELIKKTFMNHWGYIDFSIEDFMSLYSSKKLSNHLNKIYLLKKSGKVVGFLSSLHEDDSTIIFKTICVLPEFHGQGLGNALAHKAHIDEKKDGCKKIIYALMRKSNNIKNFPKDDAVVFRNYSTFEFCVL